mmetsp:Transcript_21205/g.32436  ORF Transcript_21205/g.32436 Transcript_21205/m.32436 type:complete len:266 (+) Transcript_21205:281-1078(+)
MSWSISTLDSNLSQATWESFANHLVPAWMMVGALVICLSYSLVHISFQKYNKTYRESLNEAQQLVVVQHTIEAIFLSFLFGPASYLILSLNFEEQSLEIFANKATAMGCVMFTVMFMYLVELAARFQSLRPLVVVHHFSACIGGTYLGFCLTTANIKVSSLLVYFITFEAITFVGLVMYRLCPRNRWTRPIIMAGIIIFGGSRPLQLVWIVGSLAAAWDDLVAWQALCQIILAVIFTGIQVFSLKIHISLYKKCGSLQNNDTELI